MDLLSKVKKTLKTDKRLTTKNGDLLKSKIIELVLNLDKNLLALLIKENDIRENFFVNVNEILFFNQYKFIKFVDNKEFLPNSFTTYKNKIGLMVKDRYLEENKEVVLSWPFKDCVLEAGMGEEDQKRDEVFYNEILAPDQIERLKEPKVLTSFKRIDAEGTHKVTEIKSCENFLIKGNNLLALYSVKKSILGRVKLIYIDPPYGKDADVFYNDNFKQSTWLTFMKNRLEIARELLSEDGAIFVQISDANEARIRLLLDEIFGKDNFINRITVKTKSPSGFQTVNLGVFEVAEYILLYGKSKKNWKYNPQFVTANYDENYSSIVVNKYEPVENWRLEDLFEHVSHELGFFSYKEGISKTGEASLSTKVAEYALTNADCVFRFTEIGRDAGRETQAAREKSKKNPGKVFQVKRVKHYDIYVLNGREMTFYKKKVREIDGRLTPTTLLTNIWTDISWEGIASEGGVKLKGGKKPEKLLRRIIEMGTRPGDIVLDFFLGSGTTCAVAHKMGRRFVGIEQLNYQENDSVIRLKNVIAGEQTGISKIVNWQGGGDFIYCELMELNEKYINMIAEANSSKKLLETWNSMVKKAFLSDKVRIDAFDKSVNYFEELSLENQKKFLFEVLGKNRLHVNLNEIDDKDYMVSKEDKVLNRKFYEGL